MQNLTLDQAIQFAIEHESLWSRDCTSPNWGVHHPDPVPYNRLRGPVHDRGPESGTILLKGKTLTSWGEPKRADLTFSVAKTYLALLAGVGGLVGAAARAALASRSSRIANSSMPMSTTPPARFTPIMSQKLRIEAGV